MTFGGFYQFHENAMSIQKQTAPGYLALFYINVYSIAFLESKQERTVADTSDVNNALLQSNRHHTYARYIPIQLAHI